MKDESAIERFGAFVVKTFRDEAIEQFDGLAVGRWKAPALQPLQEEVQALTGEQISLIHRVVVRCVDEGLHSFLFALVEANDRDEGVKVVVDDVDVATESDGLHGELWREDGWIAKYSKYPKYLIPVGFLCELCAFFVPLW